MRKKYSRSVVFLFFSLLTCRTFLSYPAMAQVKSSAVEQPVAITGVVVSDKGEFLPNVDVLEKNTGNRTRTDEGGAFTLKVRPGATLVFTSVNYSMQEVRIGSSEKITVKMAANVKSLNEVMVIGYGTRKKSEFTGAGVVLQADDLNKSSLSVANLLQGKASGVEVYQDDATPGAALTIRIRGTNSINAGSDPLYVVDGFPLSDNIGFSMNPGDIESITILKDAASTSIYGARGANGVVMITTKSGLNKPPKVNASASYGTQKVVGRYDLMGPYDNAVRLNALETSLGDIPPYTSGVLDSLKGGLLGTDWQKAAFHAANVQDYSVSMTGGSKRTSVFSSLDYLNQDGTVVNSKYRRIGGRLNIDQDVNDKFKMSERIFSTYGIQNSLPLNPSSINGFVKQVLKANPSSTFDEPAFLDASNPLHFIEDIDQKNTFFRVQGYFSLQYEILKGLLIKTDLGADINNNVNYYFAPSSVPAGESDSGLATIVNIQQQDLLLNPTLNYAFKTGRHSFNALLGYNQQGTYYWEQGTTATDFSSNALGYNNLSSAQQFSAYSVKTLIKRQSWFGRIDYDFDGKYIFSGTYRIDGSSVFGANNKLGYFPSASAAWNFKKEDFLETVPVISSGKARVSYGITGNDRISSGNSLATFSTDNSTIYTLNGTSPVSGIAVTALADPNLKWEQTASLDVGMDIGFFKDRLLIETDYYRKKTTNLLLDGNISPSTGFSTLIGNDGAVQNNGFEIAINTTNISSGSFKWTTGITYAINKNRVLSLGKNNADIYVGSFKPDGTADFEDPFVLRVGQQIGAIYGYQYTGIVQANDPVLTTTQPNSQPGDPKFRNASGDNVVSANDRVILGSGIPDVVAGFNTSFSYKSISLDIVLQGQFGGKLVNVQKEDLENPLSAGNELQALLTQTWSPTNTSGTIPQRGWYGNPYGGFVNSNFTESSNFVKVRNVTLNYHLPSRYLKHSGVSSLDAYVNGQNLLTFTKYSGLNPEVGNVVSASYLNLNAARGLDFNAYPMSRMFTFGIKASF
jgi:TonB-linked SusC/RagA family outer membrane protein